MMRQSMGGETGCYILADNRFMSFEHFGAIGDVNYDDTVPFQAALGKIGRKIYSSAKTYYVGRVKIADSVAIIANSGMGYVGTNLADEANLPQVKMISGNACLFDVGGTRGVFIRGVVLDGVDKSAPVVTSGSTRLTMEYCRILRGSYGIGGTVPGINSVYSRTLNLHKCVVAANGVGLINPIDSFFNICEFSDNGRNISATAGSNSNTLSACRVEWANDNYNISLAGIPGAPCGDWTFDGTIIDRGTISSIRMVYCINIQFTNTHIRRGNASGSSTAINDNLLYIEDSSHLIFTNLICTRAGDDGGTGIVSPNYVAYFNGTNDDIQFIGGRAAAGFTEILRNSSGVSNLVVSQFFGARDYSNVTSELQVLRGNIYRDRRSAVITSASNATFNLKTRTNLVQYSNILLQLRITSRNLTSGQDNWAIVNLFVHREDTIATPVLTVSSQNATFFGISSGASINISVTSIENDVSGFSLRVDNAHANSQDVICTLVV